MTKVRVVGRIVLVVTDLVNGLVIGELLVSSLE